MLCDKMAFKSCVFGTISGMFKSTMRVQYIFTSSMDLRLWKRKRTIIKGLSRLMHLYYRKHLRRTQNQKRKRITHNESRGISLLYTLCL